MRVDGAQGVDDSTGRPAEDRAEVDDLDPESGSAGDDCLRGVTGRPLHGGLAGAGGGRGETQGQDHPVPRAASSSRGARGRRRPPTMSRAEPARSS